MGCIPFFSQLAIYMAYFSLEVQDGKNDLKFLLKLIKEDKTDDLVLTAFGSGLSVGIFQLMRILISITIGTVLYIQGTVKWYIAVLIVVVIYKLFYFYLLQIRSSSIKRINDAMPYYMKTLISLSYCNPINVALVKSLDYCDEVLTDDIQRLVTEIDKDPNSYQPYKNMIDRYEGEINHLEQYFRLVYRMSSSGNENSEGLLDNLNKSISEDIQLTRKRKNDIVNNTTGYIGMMPVVLLVVVLTYILILIIGLI